MAEPQQRHRRAAEAWEPHQDPDFPLSMDKSDVHPKDAYAQGYADREAEIAANLRRRDRWGGGAVDDKKTASDIEHGLDMDWRNTNAAG